MSADPIDANLGLLKPKYRTRLEPIAKSHLQRPPIARGSWLQLESCRLEAGFPRNPLSRRFNYLVLVSAQRAHVGNAWALLLRGVPQPNFGSRTIKLAFPTLSTLFDHGAGYRLTVSALTPVEAEGAYQTWIDPGQHNDVKVIVPDWATGLGTWRASLLKFELGTWSASALYRVGWERQAVLDEEIELVVDQSTPAKHKLSTVNGLGSVATSPWKFSFDVSGKVVP